MNGNKKPRKLKLEQLERISVEEFKEADKIPLVVVLDDIRSMHNVGSVFRTSDAFRVEEIVLCGISAQPPHREINKTALGATESVSWKYEKDIVSTLLHYKEKGFQIVGAEQMEDSVDLRVLELPTEEKYVLVFGNEVNGLSESALNLYDFFVEIPQEGTKHSLNISVSAGILIWEFFKQLS